MLLPPVFFLRRARRGRLPFALRQEYDLRNVKRAVAFFILGLMACGQAGAQGGRSFQPQTVRGQLYLPNGAPLHSVVRILLESEDSTRPPEYYFTDSLGKFVFRELNPKSTYRIIVESDGKNWDTTIETFYILGERTYVTVHLRPPGAKEKKTDKNSVSVSELQQDVPRAARREYEEAMALRERGEAERSRAALERAIELFPDFVDARNELAVALLQEGKLDAAEAQLRRALLADTAAVRPLLNLGLCLYRQQRYAEALPHLERAVQHDPRHPRGNMLLGIVLVMLRQDDRAEPVLLRAYDLGGKAVAKANLYLSRIYTRRQDYARAAESLQEYLNDVPDDPGAEALRATLAKLRNASLPKP
jgi:Tfp pilus assembly protein PilF